MSNTETLPAYEQAHGKITKRLTEIQDQQSDIAKKINNILDDLEFYRRAQKELVLEKQRLEILL